SLAAGKERQFLFLAQFFGGPPRYSALHGHPRLRARHLPFPIGQRERDRWLGHMLEALEEAAPPAAATAEMNAYFRSTSLFLLQLRPEMRVSFNLTPVLLDQLQDYAEGQPGDVLLDVVLKPAADLREEELRRLLDHAFKLNVATMIDPFPRYRELRGLLAGPL